MSDNVSYGESTTREGLPDEVLLRVMRRADAEQNRHLNLARIADALSGSDGDALDRIAGALDRAYPVVSGDSAKDLDETRRLAYMALSGLPAGDRSLAGTLVNALVHHQGAATADEALKNVTALLKDPQDEEARQWLLGHVERITAELNPADG